MTEQQHDAPPRQDGGGAEHGGYSDRSSGPPTNSSGGATGSSADGGTPSGTYSPAHGEGVGTGGDDQQHVRVLDEGRSQDLRNRWNEVQTAFVDEPRKAVTDADQLVGEVLDEVSRVFREQRAELEKGWGEQNEPGTEDLRQALFRYREFFDRLLSL